MENITQSLVDHLFSDEEAKVYAVLDGASVPNLPQTLHRLKPEYFCLFRGDLEPDMALVAPYLVQLDPDTEFANWVATRGWGKHWGIFATSDADLRALRQHFRSFVMVYDTSNNPKYFRYYDPRVLRIFLPTCNAKELSTIFGPVESYLVEAEDPNTALAFQNISGTLKEEKIALGAAK